MESNFEAYNLKLQTSILNPTKHAFALPTDIQFHKSIDRDFAEEIEACSTKVLSITNKLLTLATSSTTNPGRKGKARLIVDQDDVVDDFDSVVVDIMDQLLERVVSGVLQSYPHVLTVTGFQDSCLDVIHGHNKAPVIPINPNAVEAGVSTAKFSPGVLLTASKSLSDKTKCLARTVRSGTPTCLSYHQTATQVQTQGKQP
jgi:exosome complex exonuclease RRP6